MQANYTKRHIFPGVPERINSILPNVKLIYVVRDPIERIVSHYVHNYAHGRESRAFSEVIKDFNYVRTSQYYFQIQAYLEYFSEKQLLVIESEKLREDPAKVLDDVSNFIGLSTEYNEATLRKKFNLSIAKKRKSFVERWLGRKIDNRFSLALMQKISTRFRKSIERPVLTSAEREMLTAEIAPDVEKLRNFSGKTFSDWSL